MLGFRVSFEDGHAETFAPANEVQYAAGGGVIIQNRSAAKVGERLNRQTMKMEDEVQVSVELRVVLAPARADMPAGLRWCRVETVELPEEQLVGRLPGQSEQEYLNGAPALSGGKEVGR